MKFRQHRGGLQESMATVVEVADKTALIGFLRTIFDHWHKELPAEHFPRIDHDTVHIKPYEYDERIQWDTHIVLIDHYGPIGFTDGPGTSADAGKPDA
jgi:hypothetical protein